MLSCSSNISVRLFFLFNSGFEVFVDCSLIEVKKVVFLSCLRRKVARSTLKYCVLNICLLPVRFHLLFNLFHMICHFFLPACDIRLWRKKKGLTIYPSLNGILSEKSKRRKNQSTRRSTTKLITSVHHMTCYLFMFFLF